MSISELINEVKAMLPPGTNLDAEMKKLTRDSSYTQRGALNFLKDKYSIRNEGKKVLTGYWMGGTAGIKQACYWILIPSEGVETVFVRGNSRAIPKLPVFTPITIKSEVELNVVRQLSSYTCIGPAAVEKKKGTVDPASLLSSITPIESVQGCDRKQVVSEGFVVGVGTPRWKDGKRLEAPMPLINQDSSLNLQVRVTGKPGQPNQPTVNIKVSDMAKLREIIPINNTDAMIRTKGIDWVGNQIQGEHVIFMGFCTAKTPQGTAMRNPSVSTGRNGFLALYDNLYRDLQSGGKTAPEAPEDLGHNKFQRLVKKLVKKYGKLDKLKIRKLQKKCKLSRDAANDMIAQLVAGDKHIKIINKSLVYKK
jgi:hypothetical protein